MDGILVMTPQFEEEYVQELKGKNIPFVLLDNQNYPFVEPSIVVDNFKGGYEVARHLLELGHTDIGFIGGGPRESLSSTQRWEGFTKALEEVGSKPSSVNWGVSLISLTVIRRLRSGLKMNAYLKQYSQPMTTSLLALLMHCVSWENVCLKMFLL